MTRKQKNTFAFTTGFILIVFAGIASAEWQAKSPWVGSGCTYKQACENASRPKTYYSSCPKEGGGTAPYYYKYENFRIEPSGSDFICRADRYTDWSLCKDPGPEQRGTLNVKIEGGDDEECQICEDRTYSGNFRYGDHDGPNCNQSGCAVTAVGAQIGHTYINGEQKAVYDTWHESATWVGDYCNGIQAAEPLNCPEGQEPNNNGICVYTEEECQNKANNGTKRVYPPGQVVNVGEQYCVQGCTVTIWSGDGSGSGGSGFYEDTEGNSSTCDYDPVQDDGKGNEIEPTPTPTPTSSPTPSPTPTISPTPTPTPDPSASPSPTPTPTDGGNGNGNGSGSGDGDGNGQGEGEGDGDGNGGDGEGDGECPPGETCTGAVTVDGASAKSFGESMQTISDGLENSPFMQTFEGIKSAAGGAGGGGTCPTAQFSVFNESHTIDSHCQLIEDYRSLITAVMLLVWGMLAVYIVMKA